MEVKHLNVKICNLKVTSEQINIHDYYNVNIINLKTINEIKANTQNHYLNFCRMFTYE